MSELAVPDEALTALAQWDAGTPVPHVEKGHLPTVVRAIAAPVVAAELRRRADLLAREADRVIDYDANILREIAQDLRRRADKIDPEETP